MARKPKTPQLTCPRCGRPVVALRAGKRLVQCDLERVAIVVPDWPDRGTSTPTAGYRRHVCAAKAPRKRKADGVGAVPVASEAAA